MHRLAQLVRRPSLRIRLLAVGAAAAAAGSAVAPAAPERDFVWAVIGNEREALRAERAAGVQAKVVSLSWRDYAPRAGRRDARYVRRKRAEFARARRAGFDLILSLGYHDAPPWVHDLPHSRYVDQDGRRYGARHLRDAGDANAVFNPAIRRLIEDFVRRAARDFGRDFMAVRAGGGRYGELTYPPAPEGKGGNRYWAFDRNAARRNPVPGWRPGTPAPGGEAARFLHWYLDELAGYGAWQARLLRRHFRRDVMLLLPGWGIRPRQVEAAIAGDLAGRTSAERNQEIQSGRDFARQIARIRDPRVIVTTTWLEAPVAQAADEAADQRGWSPVHYLAHLAASQVRPLRTFGENGGRDSAAVMRLAAERARRHGLMGLAWFRESELLEGRHASLEDYARVIAAG